MAVEGFSRVNKEQGAGTGEAFMLGESKALKTYVDQEQAQIAAKQKAETEAQNRELPDYGWFYTDTMNKEITAYKDAAYKAMNENGEISNNQELTRQYENLQQKAIATKKYTGRIDELNKASGEELWGKNAKYFDKSLLIKGITGKLTDENGNPKDPLQVNSKDLEDIYDPNAFLTNVFVDDFVTNIKDQYVDATTGFVKNGYGTYIQNTEKGIRFVTTDAQGNIVPGVDNNVAQLALDNPIYSQVIGKKVDEDLTNVVKKLMAEGVSEKEAKELVAIKRKDFMMEYAKEDILAYQQLSSKADMTLGTNDGTTKASLDQAEAAKTNADTNADKFKFDKGKWEKENEAAVNTDPNYRQTDIKTTSGGNATVIQLGSVQLPKSSKGKDGQGLPLDLILNNIIYTDNQNTTEAVGEDGGEMTVNGKTVKNGSIKAQELTGNQTVTIIPNDLGNQIVNDDGSIAAWSNTEGTKFDDLNNAAQKEGRQVQLFMNGWEIKKDREGKIISKRPVQVPLQGNDQAKILKTFGFNQREEAEQALDGGRNLNYTKNASPKTFRTKEEQTKAEKEKEAARGTSVLSGGTTSTNTSSSSNNTYNYLDQE